MATKIYKNAYLMGQATVDGLSFPESAIMSTLKTLFDAVQRQVDADGGVTTGPARILFTVEQEVIVPDEPTPPTCSHCGGVGHTIGAHF